MSPEVIAFLDSVRDAKLFSNVGKLSPGEGIVSVANWEEACRSCSSQFFLRQKIASSNIVRSPIANTFFGGWVALSLHRPYRIARRAAFGHGPVDQTPIPGYYGVLPTSISPSGKSLPFSLSAHLALW